MVIGDRYRDKDCPVLANVHVCLTGKAILPILEWMRSCIRRIAFIVIKAVLPEDCCQRLVSNIDMRYHKLSKVTYQN